MNANVLRMSTLPAQRVSSVMGRSSFPYWATTQTIQEQLITWAEKRNLKYSPHGHCLHWLTKGCCESDWCGEDARVNHVTGWTRDGKPALLISQPHATDFAELAKAGKRHGLEIKINENGWSGRGTVVIEIWAPQRSSV
jgi:hypothetical protein